MSTTVIIILAAILVIAIVAWLLYKTGFRLEELQVKLGLAEAKLARKPDEQTAADTAAPSTADIQQMQEATGPGSLIENSPQQAGGPGTTQRQSATAGGQITGSGQTAKAPAQQEQRAGDGGIIKNSSQKVE